MSWVIFSMPGAELLTKQLSQNLNYKLGDATFHQFPDGETHIQIKHHQDETQALLVIHLDRPNDKMLPLLLLSETLRDLGFKKIYLVCPYLPYMRQDQRFHTGEGITSKYFANLLSSYFDGLITADPHLHRYHDLSEIYSIPTEIIHTKNTIAEWILHNIKNPLLIGPDQESEQWVSEVAKVAKSPHVVLTKERRGDSLVKITLPDTKQWMQNTPVLVDDIISTAQTMIQTIHHLQAAKMKPPVCIGIHAIFAENSYKELLATNVNDIITCNTLPHITNKIDITKDLTKAILKFDSNSDKSKI